MLATKGEDVCLSSLGLLGIPITEMVREFITHQVNQFTLCNTMTLVTSKGEDVCVSSLGLLGIPTTVRVPNSRAIEFALDSSSSSFEQLRLVLSPSKGNGYYKYYTLAGSYTILGGSSFSTMKIMERVKTSFTGFLPSLC